MHHINLSNCGDTNRSVKPNKTAAKLLLLLPLCVAGWFSGEAGAVTLPISFSPAHSLGVFNPPPGPIPIVLNSEAGRTVFVHTNIEVRVLDYASIQIPLGASVTATGSVPLILTSGGGIYIQGMIDLTGGSGAANINGGGGGGGGGGALALFANGEIVIGTSGQILARGGDGGRGHLGTGTGAGGVAGAGGGDGGEGGLSEAGGGGGKGGNGANFGWGFHGNGGGGGGGGAIAGSKGGGGNAGGGSGSKGQAGSGWNLCGGNGGGGAGGFGGAGVPGSCQPQQQWGAQGPGPCGGGGGGGGGATYGGKGNQGQNGMRFAGGGGAGGGGDGLHNSSTNVAAGNGGQGGCGGPGGGSSGNAGVGGVGGNLRFKSSGSPTDPLPNIGLSNGGGGGGGTCVLGSSIGAVQFNGMCLLGSGVFYDTDGVPVTTTNTGELYVLGTLTGNTNGVQADVVINSYGTTADEWVIGGGGGGAGGGASGLLVNLSPSITNAVQQGSNLVFGGGGGAEGSTYYVLTSSNLTARMADWVPVSTNTFGVDGVFSVTNALDFRWNEFFRLQVP